MLTVRGKKIEAELFDERVARPGFLVQGA